MEDALSYAAYIDGVFVTGDGALITVENPSDESIVATLPGVSPAQVAAAIRAARQAFDNGAWAGTAVGERAAILRRYVAALAARTDRLRDLAMAEAGCPIGSSVMHAQVGTPLRHGNDIIDLFLTLPEHEENPVPLAERISAQGQVIQSLRRYTPMGVVAGIAANNVPFYTALWKVLPALIAGNSVVLRPNPLTPLSAMIFAEAAEEVGLPNGILNVVLEAGLEGAQLLTTDPAVDMVAFTGSSGVGVSVMQQAAPTMKRLQLELGGKSAQIFLPDAVERAAMQAMIVCMAHAGQGCALGTRIFVPEDRKAEVLAKAAEFTAKLRIGRADDPATQTGPVISRAQVERCERYVALAQAHGAKVVIGGRRPVHLDKGFFFEPTILDVPDNANPAAQDEIFGPVVSIIGYRDLDHAVAMANDSRFGLSGYVYGADKAAALAVALRIRSGTVHVNGALTSAYASSGGQRMSGLARERGIEGLRIFQQLSCLTIGG
ncbi:MAG: aldehyde dehydrogenase family protein [Sphingomonas sp.]